MKFDVYQIVTDSILASLEKGVRPWTRPWAAPEGQHGLPIRANGTAYQGVNVWLLWVAAAEKGYNNTQWMTFKQALALSGIVRKGEKSTMVIFFAPLTSKNSGGESEEEDGKRLKFVLRAYNVFNIEQIDGLPERFYQKPVEVVATPGQRLERIERCEKYFNSIQATVKHGGTRAFYSRSSDHIQMPEFNTFTDAESYYATLGHEHIHWTGDDKRLKREFGKRFGDQAYAAEELVAEMGSAFLCATLGLELVPRKDHVSYLAHWITVLKSDKRAIFTASSAAQKAAEYLDKLSGIEGPIVEEEEQKAA